MTVSREHEIRVWEAGRKLARTRLLEMCGYGNATYHPRLHLPSVVDEFKGRLEDRLKDYNDAGEKLEELRKGG